MVYYSAIESNKLLLHSMWMNFKSIMLKEAKHIHMCIYIRLFLFIWNSRMDRTTS